MLGTQFTSEGVLCADRRRHVRVPVRPDQAARVPHVTQRGERVVAASASPAYKTHVQLLIKTPMAMATAAARGPIAAPTSGGAPAAVPPCGSRISDTAHSATPVAGVVFSVFAAGSPVLEHQRWRRHRSTMMLRNRGRNMVAASKDGISACGRAARCSSRAAAASYHECEPPVHM